MDLAANEQLVGSYRGMRNMKIQNAYQRPRRAFLNIANPVNSINKARRFWTYRFWTYRFCDWRKCLWFASRWRRTVFGMEDSFIAIEDWSCCRQPIQLSWRRMIVAQRIQAANLMTWKMSVLICFCVVKKMMDIKELIDNCEGVTMLLPTSASVVMSRKKICLRRNRWRQ